MDTKLKIIDVECNEINEKIDTYKIVNSGDYEKAVHLLKQMKELLKQLDERRKERTRPLDESKALIMEDYKPTQGKIDKIISVLNKWILEYRVNEEKKAIELQEKYEKEAKKNKDMFVPAVTADIPKTDIKVRKTYQFKIINPDKIKKEFLIPDETKIRKLVERLHEQAIDLVGKGSIEIYIKETAF